MSHLGRAPRVLVSGVVLDQPMGGVWRHNLELLPRVAERLRSAGGELAVLVGREGLSRELPGDLELIPGDVPPRPLLVRATKESRALDRVARERGFDLVHVAHLPAPRNLDVPYTITLHDLRSLDLPHTPFSRRLFARAVIGRALRDARMVFTVSEWMVDRLAAGWPEVSPRVLLVGNAGDHLEPIHVTTEHRRRASAPLLHLGHLERRKNLELLVRTIAGDPGLPDLVLAGREDPDEVARLRNLAGELGVSERISFHGPYREDELPRLLADCAAVVLPSHLEGFGIVALEAIAAGAPLAVSTAGALTEVAGPQVPSFDPDDPAACAGAIRLALERGGEIESGGGGSWEASADAWSRGLAAALEPGSR